MPKAKRGSAPVGEVVGRRMTLAGFQREHDEVERMVLEVTSRKGQVLTNIQQQVKALEALAAKVNGLMVE